MIPGIWRGFRDVAGFERPGSNQLPSTASNRVLSSVFSLEFAGAFFGALSRIALRIPVRELGKWTKSVARLARVDIETAGEFFARVHM